MYPYSALGVLFLQVFACGVVVYLLWKAITNPKAALIYGGSFVGVVGTIYGCGIIAVKLYPEDNSFIRGAVLGVLIVAFVYWVMKRLGVVKDE